MILHEKSYKEFGSNFDTSKVYSKFYCVCDYCSKEFIRTKRNLLVGRNVIEKESCGDKKCVQRKREESQLKLYGVKNAGGTEESLKKSKATNLKKYGVNNAAQTEICKQKSRITCLKKYGNETYLGSDACRKKLSEYCEQHNVTNPAQLPNFINKLKETSRERYGVDHYSKTKEYHERTKQKALERYGVDNVLKSNEVQQKIRKTNLLKYGVESTFKCQEIQRKIRKTHLDKYGVEYALQSPEIYAKVKQTCLQKYGVEHPLQNKNIQNKVNQTKIEVYGKAFPNNFGKTQEDIAEWLLSLGHEFKNDHTILNGKEIDLYNSGLRIGIEYCGLYWHNELSPEPRLKDYHYSKYLQCKTHHVTLLTIFEDEWLNRKEQCCNLIEALLGIYQKRIFARKCSIQMIDKPLCNDFLDKNHIQGVNVRSKVRFGIFEQNTLLGIMSLASHHRQTRSNYIVLDRLCFAKGVQIVGGSSKLLKACIKWAKSQSYNGIVSWSDNRWTSGKIYEKLGFALDQELPPDYSYVDIRNRNRLSKQSQKKANTGCPIEKTEVEWAHEHGLARIWDCGKKRWILSI